jgi:hypothetical protein
MQCEFTHIQRLSNMGKHMLVVGPAHWLRRNSPISIIGPANMWRLRNNAYPFFVSFTRCLFLRVKIKKTTSNYCV